MGKGQRFGTKKQKREKRHQALVDAGTLPAQKRRRVAASGVVKTHADAVALVEKIDGSEKRIRRVVGGFRVVGYEPIQAKN